VFKTLRCSEHGVLAAAAANGMPAAVASRYRDFAMCRVGLRVTNKSLKICVACSLLTRLYIMRILIRDTVTIDVGQYNVIVSIASICYNVSNLGMDGKSRQL